MKLLDLLLYGLVPVGLVLAAEPTDDAAEEELKDPSTTPNIAVDISVSFPQSEVFGVKIVNGYPTDAVLSISNKEPAPVSLQLLGGALWTPGQGQDTPTHIVRNLTTQMFGTEIPAGEQESFTYKFSTEMHPTELVLRIVAIMHNDAGKQFVVKAFEGSVSIVEAPTSFLDPKIIFLYLLLGAGFLGTAYFVYSTWVTTLFPQRAQRGGKGGERAKASSGRSKKVNPADQVSVVGADGPAVTSSAKAYDESWIPQQHLRRPDAKRIRSGTPTGIKTKKAT